MVRRIRRLPLPRKRQCRAGNAADRRRPHPRGTRTPAAQRLIPAPDCGMKFRKSGRTVLEVLNVLTAEAGQMVPESVVLGRV
jgi:hypothetical protein